MDGACQHHNRIRRTEVAPGMSSRPADGDFEPAASKRLGDNRIAAGAVEHQACANEVLPLWFRKNVAHPAQIAFSLLANVADEHERCGMRQTEILKCSSEGQ